MTTPDHIQGPPLRDDGPLETMARAMEPLVNEDMGEPFKSAWLADLASTAITALTEAGYAIVPVEPTEAMIDAGNTGLSDNGVDSVAGDDAPTCYRAMIAAAPPIDTKEGE